MRTIIKLFLLLILITLSGCKSNSNTKDYIVKEKSFGNSIIEFKIRNNITISSETPFILDLELTNKSSNEITLSIFIDDFTLNALKAENNSYVYLPILEETQTGERVPQENFTIKSQESIVFENKDWTSTSINKGSYMLSYKISALVDGESQKMQFSTIIKVT